MGSVDHHFFFDGDLRLLGNELGANEATVAGTSWLSAYPRA